MRPLSKPKFYELKSGKNFTSVNSVKSAAADSVENKLVSSKKKKQTNKHAKSIIINQRANYDFFDHSGVGVLLFGLSSFRNERFIAFSEFCTSFLKFHGNPPNMHPFAQELPAGSESKS